MGTVTHTYNDTRKSHHSSFVGIELDDTQEQMLLSITRLHCKLGVEHGRADTTQERQVLLPQSEAADWGISVCFSPRGQVSAADDFDR